MKRTIATSALCLLAVTVCASGKTRYSGPFDYHDFKPSAAYFHGRSPAEVAHLCPTAEHASTEDLEECELREFERATATLKRKITELTAKIRKNDETDAKPEDEPVALPSFLEAQAAWVQYRDNYCYSAAYYMGEGSEKYIRFFICMSSMTKARTKELGQFFD